MRLNELPIEYYHVEALQIIGNAIGKVLRIDIHIANESKGRFTRLCIQVDIGKPPVTALLIGGKEQPVCLKESRGFVFPVEGLDTGVITVPMSSELKLLKRGNLKEITVCWGTKNAWRMLLTAQAQS